MRPHRTTSKALAAAALASAALTTIGALPASATTVSSPSASASGSAVASAPAAALGMPPCPPSTPYRTGRYTCSEQKPAVPYVPAPGEDDGPPVVVAPRQVEIDEYGMRSRHFGDLSSTMMQRQFAASRVPPVLYVVSAARPADGLAAVPLIARTGGVLGVASPYGTQLSSHDLSRFGVQRAVIIGDTRAVADVAVRVLKAQRPSLRVTRIGAATTQDTSARLAVAASPRAPTAYIVTAADVTDSAIVASVAARMRAPLLVVSKAGLTPVQRTTLRAMGVRTLVLGGDVSTATRTSLAAERAASGAPYAQHLLPRSRGAQLAAELAPVAFPKATQALVTTTGNPTAALVLAPYAAITGRPLLLKAAGCTPAAVQDLLNERHFTRVDAFTFGAATGGVQNRC